MSRKREFPGTKWRKLRAYWRRMYDSTRKSMSRGASNINKIISFPRGDNWRRKDN